ncbi:hypothetical protein SAMN04489716_3926 [Actinoplanes derwentensis]|uniref:Uncharacterized protein n=1 Tax=Actinoplanes derwentensis TaxID=113562 RepID=A0A1H2AKX5_9ACTN|nr:hypothetical protein SAMN04489716_3926 [Actinoplanes derwentensis]
MAQSDAAIPGNELIFRDRRNSFFAQPLMVNTGGRNLRQCNLFMHWPDYGRLFGSVLSNRL